MGLIWTLILKYQISVNIGLQDQSTEIKGHSPKEKLLYWVKDRLEEYKEKIDIQNFHYRFLNNIIFLFLFLLKLVGMMVWLFVV
jgi:hypothetical protein